MNYLNLNSFNTESVTSYENMFFEANISMFCAKGNIKEEIKTQLSSFNEGNCSELCYANSQKKYIVEKNICVNNCINDDTYIFEYAHLLNL